MAVDPSWPPVGRTGDGPWGCFIVDMLIVAPEGTSPDAAWSPAGVTRAAG
jgi:hypothetical protein